MPDQETPLPHSAAQSVYVRPTLERLSIETVVERLRMAAEEGDVQAQLMLAKSLELGIGTAEDKHQAFVWYKKAAENAVKLIQRKQSRTG